MAFKTQTAATTAPKCPACNIAGYWDGEWCCPECECFFRAAPPKHLAANLTECDGCEYADINDGQPRCRARWCVAKLEEA